MNSSGFATVNPSTGGQIETLSFYDSAKTENIVVLADKSFDSFRKYPRINEHSSSQTLLKP